MPDGSSQTHPNHYYSETYKKKPLLHTTRHYKTSFFSIYYILISLCDINYSMEHEYKKMDAGLLHLANKKVLLKLIKKKGKISRSELTRITGLTPPTVARIVGDLANIDQLVEYVGVGASSGGRPPVIVKFKNEGNYIIGIDLGATYIRGCLVDLNANFISEIQIPTEIENGFTSIIEKVTQVIHKLQSRKEDNAKIWGVGIGVAGLVNDETGIIESSPDFGWTNIKLSEELKSKLDLPFFFDNSTRLMALGELKLGANQNLKNFSIINVGYGIASGLVVGGQLLRGHKGFAGEFGHISVDTDSDIKCNAECLDAWKHWHQDIELQRWANKKLQTIIQKYLKNYVMETQIWLLQKLLPKQRKWETLPP